MDPCHLETILSAISWGWRFLWIHEKKIGWQRWGAGIFIMQVLPVTVKLPEFYGTILLIYPIPSMYYNGIFTYIGLILLVNVGKYTIHGLHGWYGYHWLKWCFFLQNSNWRSAEVFEHIWIKAAIPPPHPNLRMKSKKNSRNPRIHSNSPWTVFSRTKRMSCSLDRCWSNRKMDDDDFLVFRNKDL